MTSASHAASLSERELVLTRIIDAPREKLFKAWTTPELIKKWFAPLPWTTTAAEVGLRPGGSSLVVMRGPDGNEFPNREKMGFHQGWGQCTDQLAALAAKL